MNNKFATFSSAISTIFSVVGIICFFFNPIITIVCGILSFLNSLIQIFIGEQNNITTELFTIFVALVIALFGKFPIFQTICFALCIGDAVMYILGIISVLLYKR